MKPMFTLSQKYAIIHVLTAVMKSDCIIHSKEIIYMGKVMKELEIT